MRSLRMMYLMAAMLSLLAPAQPIGVTTHPTGIFAWTRPAEYHQAAVMVRAGSSGGSGTQVVCGDLACVLTAEHVVEGSRRATVIFADGTRQTGDVIHGSPGDIAAILVYNRNLPHVHVAAAPPKEGDYAETMGFGGPGDKLRHFSGRVANTQFSSDSTLYSQSVMNGDSGGGILNAKHELIGVNSFGTGPPYNGGAIAHYGSWPIYADSGSAHYTHIRGFFRRLCERFRRRAQFGGYG